MPRFSAKKGHLIFFFFLFIHEFLSTVNAVAAPPPLRREPLGGKRGWCLVKPHREPKLHQRQEKRKLLHSCAGSHSNAAVPIFKNLKDSKNIKSEGRKKKKATKNKTRFYQKEKKKCTCSLQALVMKLHMANYQFAGVQVRKYPQPQQASPWRKEAISHLPSC